MQNKLFLIVVLCFIGICEGQSPNQPTIYNPQLVVTDTVVAPYDANRPAKAAFFSAILPGLGQAYNKKYWKIPVVYAALTGGVLVYSENRRQYDELRDAFRIRLAGGTNDQFSTADGTPLVSTAALERGQTRARRNSELTILVTAAFYVLQIIDANVNGHLDQFDVSRNLSFTPYLPEFNSGFSSGGIGMGISYTF
ncbi:MAG: DUF5683 domain-containing protein [Nonlabens sp.]